MQQRFKFVDANHLKYSSDVFKTRCMTTEGNSSVTYVKLHGRILEYSFEGVRSSKVILSQIPVSKSHPQICPSKNITLKCVRYQLFLQVLIHYNGDIF